MTEIGQGVVTDSGNNHECGLGCHLERLAFRRVLPTPKVAVAVVERQPRRREGQLRLDRLVRRRREHLARAAEQAADEGPAVRVFDERRSRGRPREEPQKRP